MKKIVSLTFILFLFLPASVLAVANDYTLDQITVFVDMDKKSEQFFVSLTCLEGEMNYFEIRTEEPIQATTTNGTKLRCEILAHSSRIFFEKPIFKGESYAFYINFYDIEPRYLEENTLYYKSLSFPKDVKEFTFAIRLPKGVFPEISTSDLAQEITSWKTATTLPPNDLSIENNRVTLVWTTSLKANEKFDIGLIYPEKRLDPRLYLAFIAASIATFSVGFAIAWKRKKRAMVHVFLTEEERAIVEFIQDKGGEVYQKEIWKAETLPFSRPKVSRLIADLEDRGIIKRDPYKKTFRVSLVRY